MENNYTLNIDPETRDITFDEGGILETIHGDATSGQAVRLTLDVWKGEFPLDPTHGTEYGRIMGRKANTMEPDEIPEVIRDAIFQEPDVVEVDKVDYSIEGRGLTVSFSGRLSSGNTISSEVKTR